MIHKAIVTLFIPILLIGQTDTTALLSYNPLAIGNSWEFHSTSNNNFDHQSIIGDTIINQETYFVRYRHSNGRKTFSRIDTANMVLIGYSDNSGQEFIKYDFDPTLGMRIILTVNTSGIA